jgi:hypothetical protein
MGTGGRGPAVDAGASEWAGLGADGRRQALELAADALDVARQWTDPAAAASALLRRGGVESARDLLRILELVSGVGGAAEDGPRLAGLVAALRPLVVTRGAKKGSGTGEKVKKLAVIGRAAGYRTGVIATPPCGTSKAPGNGPKK